MPLEHFLASADNLRPVPEDLELDDVFLHRDTRKVRNDGTVRWRGGYHELAGALRHERAAAAPRRRR